MVLFKLCTICSEKKPAISKYFFRQKRGKYGLQAACKVCRSKQRMERWYDKDKNREQQKRWRENNKEKHEATWVRSKLKNNYGITLEKYEELCVKQNYVCSICKKKDYTNKGINRRLSVDHCHETGNIRGLLCSKCNLGLGYFSDDINLLYKSIEYLESNRYE